MNKTLIGLIGLALAGVASAKLPPLSDEAKATAEEAKVKKAWSDKVAAYKTCLAQNKVVERYRKNKPAQTQTSAPATAVPGGAQTSSSGAPAVNAVSAANTVTPSAATGVAAGATSSAPAAQAPVAAAASTAPAAIPACQDPGPYVAMQAASKVGVADSLPVPAAGKPAEPAAAAKK